jgi:hypothetical protein
VIEGFFLDRIHALADGLTVGERVECATDILSHLADTQLPIRDYAMMTTEATAYTAIGISLIKPGFMLHVSPTSKDDP